MMIRKNQNLISLLLVIALVLACIPVKNVSAEDIPVYTAANILTDAPLYVKNQLKARNTAFSIKLELNKKIEITKDTFDSYIAANSTGDKTAMNSIINSALDGQFPERDYGWDILEKAVEHTEDGLGNEGDYLINSFHGEYGCNSVPSMEMGGSGSEYFINIKEITFNYSFEYFTTKAEEDTFTTEAASVMKTLGLSSMTSDYDKVSAIYSYIAENITYDNEHLDDDSYTLKQSAYAALINKTAVCQGYASLFYYMAESCGLDCRIVKGSSKNFNGEWEFHAWNLVKVDGKYYYIDVTWDSGREPYEYFLEGSDSNKFKNDHVVSGLDDISSGDHYHDMSAYDISTSSYYSSKTLTEINNASVTVKNAVYDNGKCSADITVVLNGKKLIRNIDYKVTFTEFKIEKGAKSGKGYLNITGIGLYQSTIGKVSCDMTDASAEETTTETKEEKTTEKSGDNNKDSKDEKTSEDKNSNSSEKKNESSDEDTVINAVFDQPVKKGYNLQIAGSKYKVTKAGKGGTLTITGVNKKQAKVVIPDVIKIDGVKYKVNAIGAKAFKGNTKLETLVIGKNITKIGAKAFYGCRKLSKITIKSKSIKSVGGKSFTKIKTKAKVIVPKGKTSKYKKLFRKGGVSNKAKFSTK